MKKKRSFLLIEVLIAFMLITFLAFPLIRNPIYFFRSQIQSLKQIECQRIADLTFLEIKEGLYTKKISWQSLTRLKEDSKHRTLSPKTINLKSLSDIKVHRTYQIWAKGEKEAIKGGIYRKLHCHIYLQPTGQKEPYTYEYKVLMKKSTPK